MIRFRQLNRRHGRRLPMEVHMHYTKPQIERTALVGKLQIQKISHVCVCLEQPCKCLVA